MKSTLLFLVSTTARLLPMSIRRRLYRLGPLSDALRGLLNRVAPTGLSEVTVAAGGLKGTRLLLDLQSEKDYWLGTYEPELQTTVQEWTNPGMVAYDVGANIGYISLLLAKTIGESGVVYAFEALPDNVARLRINVQLNTKLAKIEIVPKAVIDKTQPTRFLVHTSGGMGKVEGAVGRQAHYQQAIEVPGVSLDNFIYEQGHPAPQIIKLDIEGGEVMALLGMRRLLSHARPLLLIELHGPEAAQVAWKTLTEAAYRLYAMKPGHPTIQSQDALGWKSYLLARPAT